MLYIIDGYNLMKTEPELAMLQRAGLELAREALIKRINSAAGLKTAGQITIVFDGHQNGNVTESSQRYGRIIVIYSKLGETADEVIKRMVRQSDTPENIKVITRDWEIKDVVWAAGSASTNISRRPTQKTKKSAVSSKDANEDKPAWNSTTRKRGPGKRPAKNQRKPDPNKDVYW